MVHLNSALRLAQHDTYTQRNTSRRSAATASADSAKAQSTTDASANTAADDFRALFTNKAAATAPATPAPTAPPTAESVFGANPWIMNPSGTNPNGVHYGYNPIYFATPATAAKVAQMVGGNVVAIKAIAADGGFTQDQPNQMVRLPNGGLVNAGIIASFYDHGYSQSYINSLVANEVNATNT